MNTNKITNWTIGECCTKATELYCHISAELLRRYKSCFSKW